MSVVSLGCRLNAFEGDAIRARLAALGADGIAVVNTCAVTAEAEKQARQEVRRLRRARPDARIVVTGCAAQIAPERFAALAEADHVAGNAEKRDPAYWSALIAGRAPRMAVRDILSAPPPPQAEMAPVPGQPRAYLEIQQGCDHRCTFCIIPYGRGPSRSLPLEAIAAEAVRLAAQGFREFVLTGVDITAYGADLAGAPTLGQTARALLEAVPGIARLRFSSLDPAELDGELLRLFAEEPRVMPHAHLSLQSGDDLILKRMKRRHTRAEALAAAAALREARPGIALGADLIAGFPTEDEAAFARTLALVDDIGLAYLHVFPYSPRPGTPAAKMPQVPLEIRKARAALLRQAGEAALGRFLASRVGAEASILVEQPGLGRDETYAPVALPPDHAKGAIIAARIAAAAEGKLRLAA